MALTPAQQQRIAEAIIANYRASGMNPDAMLGQLIALVLKPRAAQLTKLAELAQAVIDDIDENLANQAARYAEESDKLTTQKAALQAALTEVNGS